MLEKQEDKGREDGGGGGGLRMFTGLERYKRGRVLEK